MPDPAPRVGAYQAPGLGGASCRTACANDYYACARTGEMTACGGVWAQCQAACPDSSASE